MSVDNYFLLVESLDTEVVAFAPMLASSYPRVIAVGEGNGDLLRVTLLLPEECRASKNKQLSKQVSDFDFHLNKNNFSIFYSSFFHHRHSKMRKRHLHHL